MIIDGHSHGLHGGYLDQMVAAGGEPFRKALHKTIARAQLTPQLMDVPLRVRQLEKYGYDGQVVTIVIGLDANVFPIDAEAQLAVARAINDNMARLMEDSKGKLIAGGSIPLASMNRAGQREMERAIRTLGLKAISLPSTIRGTPLDSPEFEPFWDLAEEMNVPVFIHPFYKPGHAYEDDFDIPHMIGWTFETAVTLCRLVFSGVMDRHPSLKIVSHHLGGGIPFFMGRIIESNDRSSSWDTIGPPMPLPLNDYYSRFYYDSAIGGSVAATKCAIEVFGADQVVFATDAPNGPGRGESRIESYPNVIRSLGLSQADTERILAGNIRRILNLD